MGATLPSLWRCVHKPKFNTGYLVKLENCFGRQRNEEDVASGTFMLILNEVEG